MLSLSSSCRWTMSTVFSLLNVRQTAADALSLFPRNNSRRRIKISCPLNCKSPIAMKALHYSSPKKQDRRSWRKKIKAYSLRKAGEAVHFVREIRGTMGDVGNPVVENNSCPFSTPCRLSFRKPPGAREV